MKILYLWYRLQQCVVIMGLLMLTPEKSWLMIGEKELTSMNLIQTKRKSHIITIFVIGIYLESIGPINWDLLWYLKGSKPLGITFKLAPITYHLPYMPHTKFHVKPAIRNWETNRSIFIGQPVWPIILPQFARAHYLFYFNFLLVLNIVTVFYRGLWD